MSEHDAAMSNLVPGRECGACTVCCVALTIDDPELQKLQGYRCRNLSKQGGCSIYPTRPRTCRTFHCGWRHLRWVRETLRPDISGVLVRLHGSKEKDDQRLGVIVSLRDPAALKAEGLAETVAAAVKASVPLYLGVPGPPGHTAGLAKLNDALEAAVLTKDKPAVLEILRRGWRMGKGGKTVPIVLKPHAEVQGPD